MARNGMELKHALLGYTLIAMVGIGSGTYFSIYGLWSKPYWSDIPIREAFYWKTFWWGLVPAFLLVIRALFRANRKGTKLYEKELEQQKKQAQALAEERKAYIKPVPKKSFDGLVLGISTGFLDGRGHYSGFPNGEMIKLSPNDCCKNIWICGGIGGGKTSRVINPLLQQILSQQDCSALVFDIKGDFRQDLDYLANRTSRTYQVVGDGGMTLNLFRGCTPEVAASYLKSCFIAGGTANGDGAFWVETATNYCRNLLTLIKLAQGDYSIAGLADHVFSEKKRLETLQGVRDREQAGQLDSKEARVWTAVLGYMVETVQKWDDKFRSNVQGTCETVLNAFVHPDLVDAFSFEAEHGEADLYDLLNKPSVFYVNLPRHKFGAQGARYAYLLIKLRFFSMMAERRSHSEVNQDRYVAFLCDEYQTIVDSVSDTDFWDKSRSSKCFGVISMQGYSSLVQAVGGTQVANALLQNWRQRVILRTEDQATIEMVQRTLGQVDVILTSTSNSENSSTGRSVSGMKHTYSSGLGESNSESTTIQRQHLIDANDFRMFDAEFALLLGNIGDRAADEVLTTQPVYIPE